jgi:iron-sulfur cluster repair protein YtfE (RIC family)
MSEEEIKLLEKLLEKLEAHLGHPYAIVYPIIQDGFSIGIYDRTTNKLLQSQMSHSLQSTINKILKYETSNRNPLR